MHSVQTFVTHVINPQPTCAARVTILGLLATLLNLASCAMTLAKRILACAESSRPPTMHADSWQKMLSLRVKCDLP